MKNHNSESKTLCNLAYAQTQLNQLKEAAKTFSNALTSAYQANNNFLQFQTCEGLGSTNHQMGRYGDAVGCFEQALAILDAIGEDTGIARERVMEKLSESTEALEQRKEISQESTLQSRGDEENSSLPSGTEDEVAEERQERLRAHSLPDSQGHEAPIKHSRRKLNSLVSRKGMKLRKAKRGGEKTDHKDHKGGISNGGSTFKKTPRLTSSLPTTTGGRTREAFLHEDKEHANKKLSITERRGAKTLPPIKTTETSLTTKPAATPVQKGVLRSSKKGKEKLTEEGEESADSTELQLQAYLDSYRDSSDSSWSQGLEASTDMEQPVLPNTQGPSALPSFGEGSLALGPNAREQYTVQTVEVWSKGRGGRKKHKIRSEIVQTSPPGQSGEQASLPSQLEELMSPPGQSGEQASPPGQSGEQTPPLGQLGEQTSPPGQSGESGKSQQSNRHNTEQRSSVCIIL